MDLKASARHLCSSCTFTADSVLSDLPFPCDRFGIYASGRQKLGLFLAFLLKHDNVNISNNPDIKSNAENQKQPTIPNIEHVNTDNEEKKIQECTWAAM